MEDFQPPLQPQIRLDSENNLTPETAPYIRPLGFSILLIFSIVYNGFMFLVLAAGMFYNSIVQQIIEQYYHQVKISSSITFLLNLSGVLFFATSIFGLIKLWRARRSGFWYFATSQFIILFTVLVFLRSYDWINMAIATIVLILIGLYARKVK